MDENKLKRLKEVGYVINNTCNLCKHSVFVSGYTDWGTCGKHKYSHLKHSDSERQMSINRSGGCKDFEIGDNNGLDYFEQFMR